MRLIECKKPKGKGEESGEAGGQQILISETAAGTNLDLIKSLY